MIKIGLTGSIASGKTEVTNILKKMRIPVFDADAMVHQFYEDGTAAGLLKPFCPQAISNHRVDRELLGQYIAKHPTFLKQLEAIIHPLVQEAQEQFINTQRKLNYKLVVIDSPLLIETGQYKNMDVVVVITTSTKLQKQRALQRKGMTETKLEFMLSKQMPAFEKIKYATHVIVNEGTLENLHQKVTSTFRSIQEKANQHA